MKAIQITEKGKVRVTEVPKPVLRAGHVLLKICYVGLCGSDLNTFRGLNPLVQLPVIPGHEIGARIEAVAPDVPPGLIPGMSVTVNPYTSCGTCSACVNDRPNACQSNQTLGVQRDGALTEYLLVPWEKVIGDSTLSVRDFALVEPMSVGFHAVSRAAVTRRDTVMVLGCGMIGMGAIRGAALRGATVIAVDVDDTKLSLARQIGACQVINSCKEDLHERVCTLTAGRGADVVIEAVGRPETYLTAIAEVAFTGRVIYIGYAKEEIPFDTSCFVKKELDIRGSRNALPADFQAVIEDLKQGEFPADAFISAVYPAQEASFALEKWSAHPGETFRMLIRF